jgi:hypothetical protein
MVPGLVLSSHQQRSQVLKGKYEVYDRIKSVAAFRTNIVAMLQDTASLESLSIQSSKAIKADDFIALVTALQHNITLKKLDFVTV